MRDRPANSFDAIRLVAALAVIFGHAYPLLQAPSPGLWGLSVQTLAVRAFFAISGYLVCESWARDPSFFRFFARRGSRLFPGLTVAVLATILVLGPLTTTLPVADYFANEHTRWYLTNAVLNIRYNLPAVFESLPYANAVNGSLWSLPVEFAAYCLVPILLAPAIARWQRWTLPATCIVSWLAFELLGLVTEGRGYVVYGTNLYHLLELFPYFFAGAWLGTRFRREALLELGIVAFVAHGLVEFPAAGNLIRVVGFSSLVLGLAFLPSWLGARAAAFGDLSYGIYLYGFPLQQLMIWLGWGRSSPLINFMVSAPLAALCAFTSWHLIEKRALSRTRLGLARLKTCATAKTSAPP